MDCVFCRIIAKKEPARIIYEDDEVMSFYGLHDIAPVHVLVVPKKHIVNVMDISEADERIIFRIHQAIQKVAVQLGVDQSGFRVITNTGRHGQQEVFHMHYHVIGGRQLEWEM